MPKSSHTRDIFEDHGDDWWQPDGTFWTLHRIQPLRFKWIKNHLPDHGAALDIGCGGGLMAEDLCLQGFNVTAIDGSKSAIHCARKHAKTNQIKIDYRHGFLENILQPDETFDVICLLEVLEHVDQPQQLLHRAINHLNPNGRLFCSTLNRNVFSFFANIIAVEYLLQWLPVGTHQYDRMIKPSELNQWALDSGLQSVAMTGINYDICQQQFILTPRPTVNYLMCFQYV